MMLQESNDDLVLAAGGVITRNDKSNAKALLVHRPRYDDWSFPKGKLDPGETMAQCAFREVLEETGFRCDLLEELEPTAYRDHKGRTKLVRYWHMTIVSGEFTPNEEVDEMRWVKLSKVNEHLSYARDHVLIGDLMAQ
jgi:8-oxo-dGTP pyrophosphatase MutT (NUDIX family)